MRQLKITQKITNREDNSIEIYLQEIGKIQRISPEEEVRLTRLIKQGDLKALDKLTVANLRFVVSVAKQYQNQGLPLPDLINEGNYGLIKAAKRFDETRGFKFISYAVWWIRQSILQALVENSRMVRIPLNKMGTDNKIFKTSLKFEQDFEREPTAEEISEILEMDIYEVSRSLNRNSKHISLDAPVADGEEITVLDSIKSNEFEIDPDLRIESLREKLKPIINQKLNARDGEIMKLWFGIGCNPLSKEEIGERFNLTVERVRQVKERCIKKLTKYKHLLKEYR